MEVKVISELKCTYLADRVHKYCYKEAKVETPMTDNDPITDK